MAKVGRNEPCPCGSGRKAKRCCGIERGPSEESLARAFLAHASRDGAARLAHLCDEEFVDLFEGTGGLPAIDLSLQVVLPKVASPALGRLCAAVADDDPDPELLAAVAGSIDTPLERARLARAVIDRAQAGAIDELLAAARSSTWAAARRGSCAPACWRPSLSRSASPARPPESCSPRRPQAARRSWGSRSATRSIPVRSSTRPKRLA